MEGQGDYYGQLSSTEGNISGNSEWEAGHKDFVYLCISLTAIWYKEVIWANLLSLSLLAKKGEIALGKQFKLLHLHSVENSNAHATSLVRDLLYDVSFMKFSTACNFPLPRKSLLILQILIYTALSERWLPWLHAFKYTTSSYPNRLVKFPSYALTLLLHKAYNICN